MIDAVLAAKRPICGRWHKAEDTEVQYNEEKNALYADLPSSCEGLIIPLAFLDNDTPEPNCADKSMNSTSVTLRGLRLMAGTPSGSSGWAFVDQF
jgi:hypothetical protein